MVLKSQGQKSALTLGGERTVGEEVRVQNVTACASIANIVKSSLGPVGLDKMLVDEIGDVTVTNDGATILKLLDVEHPAAKVLVELADQQDKEVGDGTTSVVIIAAELLKRANDLVRNKLHPTTIISGFRLASKEACKYIADNLTTRVDELGHECLVNVARTAMSSKLLGADSAFFSNMAVEAMLAVKTTNSKGQTKYPVNSVNVLKSHGKSFKESIFVSGYALNCSVAAQAMKKSIVGAKIACLDMDLKRAKMGLGVSVVVTDPDQIEAVKRREADITREQIEKILSSGANVILTTKGIDDLALKLFIDRGCLAVRRCAKADLKRIARATGATLVSTLANLEGEESFDIASLGHAEEVFQQRVSDDELVIVKNPKVHGAASIILRGPNEYSLDEMERSLHDVLCVIKRTLESNRVVPGGGCVEAALSLFLEKFATTLASREQLAIAEFAQALLVIPKTLASNAAKDSTELVAKLRAYHNAAQTDAKKSQLKWTGLELHGGTLRDNRRAGVLEPAMSKIKSLRAATEAAIAILRIDAFMKLNPPPPPQDDGHGH
eukprot:Lithocolla_globosa_v1_NODE_2567_length_1950_cov_17.572559.p1 type:complete len:554 gc:universal NODE_2567_length_1950_cov_17.572559:1906-245(-)